LTAEVPVASVFKRMCMHNVQAGATNACVQNRMHNISKAHLEHQSSLLWEKPAFIWQLKTSHVKRDSCKWTRCWYL